MLDGQSAGAEPRAGATSVGVGNGVAVGTGVAVGVRRGAGANTSGAAVGVGAITARSCPPKSGTRSTTIRSSSAITQADASQRGTVTCWRYHATGVLVRAPALRACARDTFMIRCTEVADLHLDLCRLIVSWLLGRVGGRLRFWNHRSTSLIGARHTTSIPSLAAGEEPLSDT